MSFIRAIAAKLLAWGPWGAFLLSIMDSAGVPLPEGVDALIVFLAAQSAAAGYFGAALAVIGSVIGSLFLFYLGRKGGEEYLDKKTQHGWPKRFRHWFHHYGGLAIFIPVLIPAPLPVKIFVLSAGALGMRRSHFVAIIFIARSIRYFSLAYLGTQLGTSPWQYITGHAWQLALISLGLFVLLYAAIAFKDYLRRRAHHHELRHFE